MISTRQRSAKLDPCSVSNSCPYSCSISYTTLPVLFGIAAPPVTAQVWPVSETGRTARVSAPPERIWRQQLRIDTDPGRSFGSAGVDPGLRALTQGRAARS